MPFVALCGVENFFRWTCFDCLIAQWKCCPKYTNIIVADQDDLKGQRFHDLIDQAELQAEEKKQTRVIKVQLDTEEEMDKYRLVIQAGIFEFAKNCMSKLTPSEEAVKDKDLKKQEALEKFKFACELAKVDINQRYYDGVLLEKEEKAILKNVTLIRERSNKACILWQKFAYLEIRNLFDLKQLKKLNQITQVEFDVFKPLLGKKFKTVDTFKDVNTDDKNAFLKAAKKTKAVADEKFCSWLSVRKTKETKPLVSGTLFSAVMKSTKKNLSETVDSGAGAFESKDHLVPTAESVSEMPIIADFQSPDEKYENAKVFVETLADDNSSEDYLELGYKKLEIICKLIDLNIEDLKSKKIENKKLIEEIHKFKTVSSAMFHVFLILKQIEKIEEDQKTAKLKEKLTDEIYTQYLIFTKGKRKRFNETISKAKELIDLDIDTLIIIFNIASKFSKDSKIAHSKTYPSNFWFEGIGLQK
ncbi:MAG: hypothetical protein K1060chlam5_01267 [Candidatus Anoxychlamydiales bacterium]|nr:hypothetical protein [Candidatus Anoxychlamydiales bacterium]